MPSQMQTSTLTLLSKTPRIRQPPLNLSMALPPTSRIRPRGLGTRHTIIGRFGHGAGSGGGFHGLGIAGAFFGKLGDLGDLFGEHFAFFQGVLCLGVDNGIVRVEEENYVIEEQHGIDFEPMADEVARFSAALVDK